MKKLVLFLGILSLITFDNTFGQFVCGDSITINHVAGDLSPVSKTVIYGTIDSVPGELSKCWTTSNLGADHQAISKDDATEASAGWYWQFNRKQGFMHDGINRTPNLAWISEISEDSDWLPVNDPCNLELGNGWRIPTQSEWANVNNAGGWVDSNGPWESLLKLHGSGFLAHENGTLNMRGQGGSFWTSLQGGDNTAWNERYNDTLSGCAGHYKSRGFSLRCVWDDPMTGMNPEFSADPVQGLVPLMVQFTDETSGNPTTWKWDFENDGVYDAFVQNPSFTYYQPGLYSVKLFVQNAGAMDSIIKTGYILADTSVFCGEPITVTHVAGNIAPITKTVTYEMISNVPGEPSKCWTTSNLGADHQAISKDDATEASAGWYWQFNRQQGFMHDGTTRTPNTTWITNISENSDWIYSNDPCLLELGNGWRIPTQSEWANVNDMGGWIDWNGPWDSPLKLHAGGFLAHEDGTLNMRGEGGAFWSNLEGSANTAWHERFTSSLCGVAGHYKSRGYSLRCVKSEPVIYPPEICIVSTTPENHNQVIWEKQSSDQIASYNIYRETTQANVFEVIGSVPGADSSIFVDVTSNPQQQAYKYKLSAVSAQNIETTPSNYHRTIHLTINTGPMGWNLLWSPYEGFPYGTYYIYRGSDPGYLTVLDSISASFTSYTDIDPPSGPLYYAIEVVNAAGCFPSRDGGFNRSRSNIQYNGVVGLEENSFPGIRIYPNPAKDVLNFDFEGKDLQAEVIIFNLQGKILISKHIRQENRTIGIEELKPGVYLIRLMYQQKILSGKLIVQ